VRENAEEIAGLQALLDASHARAGPHLRSIFRDEHRFTAEQLVVFFTGPRQIAVATVSAEGEPRVAPVDALLLHGRFHFGTHRTAARVGHLRARPAVSLAYFERDELAVVVHGTAELLELGHPDFRAIDQAFVDVYGGTPSTADEGSVYARVEAKTMFTYARELGALRHTDA
jgi:Pyridoxamine 5'-phosphate oxidase